MHLNPLSVVSAIHHVLLFSYPEIWMSFKIIRSISIVTTLIFISIFNISIKFQFDIPIKLTHIYALLKNNVLQNTFKVLQEGTMTVDFIIII